VAQSDFYMKISQCEQSVIPQVYTCYKEAIGVLKGYIIYLREKRWKCILAFYIVFWLIDVVMSTVGTLRLSPLKLSALFLGITFGEVLYKKKIIINFYALIGYIIFIYAVFYLCGLLEIAPETFF